MAGVIDIPAFSSKGASTVSLAVTNASGAVAVDSTSGIGKAKRWRVYNLGAALVFVEFGSSAITAAVATGMPIPPGDIEVFSPAGATHCAAITSSGTATLYITPGEGI